MPHFLRAYYVGAGVDGRYDVLRDIVKAILDLWKWVIAACIRGPMSQWWVKTQGRSKIWVTTVYISQASLNTHLSTSLIGKTKTEWALRQHPGSGVEPCPLFLSSA